jgi:hypothetical protein
MAYQELIEEIEVLAGGATFNLDVDSPITQYNIITTGTVVVGTDNNINVSGTPVEGLTYTFYYDASVDSTSTADVVIFGKDIPNNLWETKHMIRCYYDGSKWEMSFFPDFAGSSFIGLGKLAKTPSPIITATFGASATANAPGIQELASLTIPADEITTNGEAFKVIAWGTCSNNPAELKNIQIDAVAGATITLYTNSNVDDLVGDWRVELDVTVSNVTTGQLYPSGYLMANANGNNNVDPYSEVTPPTGYDPTIAQLIKIYGEEQTPSGNQITLLGARIFKF